MKHWLSAVVVIVAGSLPGIVRAETPIMELDDVRPGMTGVMRTVFSGTAIEEVPWLSACQQRGKFACR